MQKIKNEDDYKKVMATIENLMLKGSDKVSNEELEQIRSLAQLAQSYEQVKYEIDFLS